MKRFVHLPNVKGGKIVDELRRIKRRLPFLFIVEIVFVCLIVIIFILFELILPVFELFFGMIVGIFVVLVARHKRARDE